MINKNSTCKYFGNICLAYYFCVIFEHFEIDKKKSVCLISKDECIFYTKYFLTIFFFSQIPKGSFPIEKLTKLGNLSQVVMTPPLAGLGLF